MKLSLDMRRIPVGQRLDFSLTAKDAKGVLIPDVTYEVKVELEGEGTPKYTATPESLFNKGDQWQGFFSDPKAVPGTYRVTAVAKHDNKEVGWDSLGS